MLCLHYSFHLIPYIELYTEQDSLRTLQDACQQHPCVDHQQGHVMISLHNLTTAMGNATLINFTIPGSLKNLTASTTQDRVSGTTSTQIRTYSMYRVIVQHIQAYTSVHTCMYISMYVCRYCMYVYELLCVLDFATTDEFHVPQRPDMVQTLTQQATRKGSNEYATGINVVCMHASTYYGVCVQKYVRMYSMCGYMCVFAYVRTYVCNVQWFIDL